jgi:hypothetical protein
LKGMGTEEEVGEGEGGKGMPAVGEEDEREGK